MRRGVVAAVIALPVLVGACSDDDVASPGSSTTVAVGSSTTAAVGVFASSVEPVTAENLSASWRPGCPVSVEDLRLLRLSHWGFDGAVHQGRLVVAADVTEEVTEIFRELYDAHYEIERMEPVDAYGGSDDASMGANNTSAFNCRRATGGTGWSEHAYGRAIDLNPLQNPFVRGEDVLPPQSAHYLDRTLTDTGMIHDGDAAVTAFAARGWVWGGTWSTSKDYQHFSPSGR